jgi:hypothetical protein
MKKFISLISLISTCAFAQEYQFTTPISGYLTMSAEDTVSGQSGSFQLNLSSLTEDVYLNPINLTVREVGSISYTPSASDIVITRPGATLTVSLAPAGGVLSFDTGYLPLTGSAGGQYSFNGMIPSFIGIGGSYSLVTGGQTYAGSFNYNLNALYGSEGYIGYQGLLATGYPNSIILNNPLNYERFYSPEPNPVANVTAENGLQVELELGQSGYYEICTATLPSSVTACAVPEPTSVTIGLCALGLVFFRYKVWK